MLGWKTSETPIASNGAPARSAARCCVAEGGSAAPLTCEKPQPPRSNVDGLRCRNPRCITNHELYLPQRFKRPAEVVGGVILILLGIKILLEHLGILVL